jgi:hypothetical protein
MALTAPTMESLAALTKGLHDRLDHAVQLLQKIANRVPLHRFAFVHILDFEHICILNGIMDSLSDFF